MKSLPSSASSSRLRRASSVRFTRPGWLARMSRRRWKSAVLISGMDRLLGVVGAVGGVGGDEGVDLVARRHRGRALEPRGDDGAGGVREGEDPLEVPALQQAVGE